MDDTLLSCGAYWSELKILWLEKQKPALSLLGFKKPILLKTDRSFRSIVEATALNFLIFYLYDKCLLFVVATLSDVFFFIVLFSFTLAVYLCCELVGGTGVKNISRKKIIIFKQASIKTLTCPTSAYLHSLNRPHK